MRLPRNVKVAAKICFILAFLLEMPFNFHVNAYGSQSIQELINSATSGSVVQVPPGTYYENNIEINKSIILRGAGSSCTIIDGSGGILPIIKVLVSNVTIEGFTIRNTASSQETYGIVLKKVSNVTIRNNNLTKCYIGIRIENSSYCRIVGNQIVSNFAFGLFFVSDASNNVVAGNLIKKNPIGLIIYQGCTLNNFFHNNFIDNQRQIDNLASHNKFDNGFEGNYWSDYNGADLNLDGIGDEAYNDLDNYPLMGAFYFIETESQYGFEVISNLTIVDFTYNAVLRELRIDTEGLNGSVGFCRISIPYALISPPYHILIDGGQTPIHYINYSVYSNSTHQWIYFDYYIHLTRHEIVIIPEGLLHIILPTIIIVIVTAVFLKKPYLNLKLKSK